MWVEEHEQVEREREGITIIGKEKSRERKDRRRERAAMLMFCCCGVLCEMDASPRPKYIHQIRTYEYFPSESFPIPFFFFDVCRTVPYFYVLQTRVVLGLGKDSELVSGTPWRPATIDNRSACGIVIPSRVRGRLQHTMGNVGCALFG